MYVSSEFIAEVLTSNAVSINKKVDLLEEQIEIREKELTKLKEYLKLAKDKQKRES